MKECTGCGEQFGSLRAFDAHRVGKHLQTGSSEYTGPLEEWATDKRPPLPHRRGDGGAGFRQERLRTDDPNPEPSSKPPSPSCRSAERKAPVRWSGTR
jgi:hypothetical protein